MEDVKQIVDNEILHTGTGKENLQVIKIGKPVIGYQEQHAFSNLNVTLLEEILKVYTPIIKVENKIKEETEEINDGIEEQEDEEVEE